MKKQLAILMAIVFIDLGFTNCSSIFTRVYGIKSIKQVSNKSIERIAIKYRIPSSDSYELDSSFYDLLHSLDSNIYEQQIKNHSQPLQALYYDSAGQLKSYLINCYAGGFPNLNWQGSGTMNTFPPMQMAPIDSLVNLETHLKYFKPLSQTSNLSTQNYNYVVVVFWNRFMGRQSKRLIRFVQENIKLGIKEKVKIIYVNNDNYFSARLSN